MIKQETTSDQVIALLERHRSAGLHIDDRVFKETRQPGKLFLGKLDHEQEFLNLVWQSIADARPLVPERQPRTLRDCAARLSNFDWRFEGLVEQDYRWFRCCVDIDSYFDWAKFGPIILTELLPIEKYETPAGNYYIYDGAHRTIVLAKRLLREESTYKPINFVQFTSRRS